MWANWSKGGGGNASTEPASAHPPTHLLLVGVAGLQQAQAEAQVVAFLQLLPKQLALAAPVQRHLVRPQALLQQAAAGRVGGGVAGGRHTEWMSGKATHGRAAHPMPQGGAGAEVVVACRAAGKPFKF